VSGHHPSFLKKKKRWIGQGADKEKMKQEGNTQRPTIFFPLYFQVASQPESFNLFGFFRT
jgi:hypothetical protein